MPVICGLDPSLTHTAGHLCTVGEAIDVDPCLVRSFAIKSVPKLFAHPVARLHYLSVRLAEELTGPDGMQVKDGLLVVEGYAMGARNGREVLGEWGGQIRLFAYRFGWNVLVVPPSSLKKYTTGKGNAEKETVMLEVFKRWAYSSTDNNDADAYALMRLGADWLRWKAGADPSKRSAECFAKLEVWKRASRSDDVTLAN